MSALRYLKLDWKVVRGYSKFYILFPTVFFIGFVGLSPMMAVSYLLLFLVILSSAVFSLTGAEKCDRLYYILPGRSDSMVLGRYLYLLCLAGVIFLVDGSALLILHAMGRMSTSEIAGVAGSAGIALLVCLIQYPLFYYFGYEKGRLASMLLYVIPAVVIFALPGPISSIMAETSQTSVFPSGGAALAVGGLLLLVAVCGVMSYKISCRICKNKEF